MDKNVRTGYKEKIVAALLSFATAIVLAGCSANNITSQEPSLSVGEYSKKIHEKTQVQVGDISPVFDLSLKEDGYAVTTYGGLEETMEIEDVCVEEGSVVEAGDVLIRFRSKEDEESKKRDDYVNRMEEDRLLIEHLARLAILDPKSNYYTDTLLMENDIKLMQDKIEEIDSKKERLTYRANVDGTVSYISTKLYNGYAPAGEALIRTVNGSDTYIAQTTENYHFVVGTVYEAVSGMARVDMVITDVIEDGNNKTVMFKPCEDQNILSSSDEYRITVEKEIMPNSVYVNSKAIRNVAGKDYVYVLDNDGYMSAKEVKVRCVTGDNSIIDEGLSGGEWLAID